MKFAVSNIAWPHTDRDAAYAIMRDAGIGGLEIAPGLFFNGAVDVFDPSDAEAAPPLLAMREAGLQLVSMQSLLFGVQGAALFGDEGARAVLDAAILRAIQLAGRFGIPNLVFGAPGQRVIPDDLADDQAEEIALAAFRRFGDHALAARCRVAVEPNPAEYNTNFLNSVSQALEFVEKVDHPAVSLNLDIGAMHMCGDFDGLDAMVDRVVAVTSHVHFSEAHLGPAPARIDQAAHVMTLMDRAGYAGWYSIEMRASAEDPLGQLEACVGKLLAAADKA